MCKCEFLWAKCSRNNVPMDSVPENTLLIERLQQRAVFKILSYYPNPHTQLLLSIQLCGPSQESSNDTSWQARVQTAG